jgi:hypothetical protein
MPPLDDRLFVELGFHYFNGVNVIECGTIGLSPSQIQRIKRESCLSSIDIETHVGCCNVDIGLHVV